MPVACHRFCVNHADHIRLARAGAGGDRGHRCPGRRKCIKPKERASKPIDLLFTPLTCLEPVVNVNATPGNQAESFVNVKPTNPNNLVATSNNLGTASISARTQQMLARPGRAARSPRGGGVLRRTGRPGTRFGNLFLVYINANLDQINVILSTDGGATFSAPVTAGTGSID